MNRATYYSPQAGRLIDAPRQTRARFAIGDVVKHRHYDFRGVVFDIDPVFANSEEWYQSIPADVRPTREQPFYHLLAENEDASYVAYVSQQNLLGDAEGGPVDHPSLAEMFEDFADGRYRLRQGLAHQRDFSRRGACLASAACDPHPRSSELPRRCAQSAGRTATRS